MDDSFDRHRLLQTLGVWTLLYLGAAAMLFVLFVATNAAPGEPTALAGLALAFSVAIVALAFISVVVDRLLFTRDPQDLLTRQSSWVLVLVALTVVTTGGILVTVTASPGDAVLLGISAAIPTTMVLFVAINLARYRTMGYTTDL